MYLIPPQPIFVVTCETVDNDRDGESQDEDSTQRTKST